MTHFFSDLTAIFLLTSFFDSTWAEGLLVSIWIDGLPTKYEILLTFSFDNIHKGVAAVCRLCRNSSASNSIWQIVKHKLIINKSIGVFFLYSCTFNRSNRISINRRNPDCACGHFVNSCTKYDNISLQVNQNKLKWTWVNPSEPKWTWVNPGEHLWTPVNPSEPKWTWMNQREPESTWIYTCEPKKIPINLIKPKWTKVSSSEVKWTQVSLGEPKWTCVSPSEPEWTWVSPSEPEWTQVKPSETKGNQKNPCEPKWTPEN